MLTAFDGATAAGDSHRPPRPGGAGMMLPDQDGWAITRAVRSDANMANLPVIMLTARVETDRIIGLELGADDYVPKPLPAHKLRAGTGLRRSGNTPQQHTSLSSMGYGSTSIATASRDGQLIDVLAQDSICSKC
ncbi:MAG: response regulator [Kouleothrix sp.]